MRRKRTLILIVALLTVFTFTACVAPPKNQAEKEEKNQIVDELVDDEEIMTAEKSDFLGVWVLREFLKTRENDVDRNAGESEKIVFTDEDKVYRLRYREDGSLMSKEIASYSVKDAKAQSDLLVFGEEEAGWWWIKNDRLVCETDEAEYAVYEKIEETSDALIFEQVTKDFEPAKHGTIEYKEYPTPTFEKNKTIYEVFDIQPVWVMVGIADNGSKVKIPGEQSEFTLDDFKDMAYTVMFYQNGDLIIYGDVAGIIGSQEGTYTIEDTYYCDQAPVDGMAFRFYLGDDGLIYATYYYQEAFINAEVTDYVVLAPMK